MKIKLEFNVSELARIGFNWRKMPSPGRYRNRKPATAKQIRRELELNLKGYIRSWEGWGRASRHPANRKRVPG